MTDISAISSYFTSLVTDLMALERQPLVKLQQDRDDMNTSRAMYTDVSSKLSSLRDSTRALISTESNFALNAGRNVSVTNVPTGSTVLSASVSNTAVTGTYVIDNIVLGKQHRVRSDQQSSSDQALNMTGTILLGGAADRSQSAGVTTLGTTVTGFSTGDPATGQTELGSGAYSIQTRQSGSTYQFRLVNSNGNALNIKNNSSGMVASDWQDIPAGASYDTGRGLKINFASDSAAYQVGSAVVNYTAKGVSLAIDATDSLNSIANKINNTTFPQGQGISATVIDRQLVLEGATPGIGHDILASDTGSDPDHKILAKLGVFDGGGAYKNLLQAADANTTFRVNGQTITRFQNSGISDVISGVTLNFAPDAVGKTATINVASSWTNARSAIDGFISKFNDVQTYLGEKTGVTQVVNGTTTSYKRGALAGNSAITDLRDNLFSAFYSEATSGTYKYLTELGLSIDDSLKITVKDSTKLENALANNPTGVKTLMDQVAGKINTLLNRYTGEGNTQGYVANQLASIDAQMKDMGTDITNLTSRLADRQTALTDQYAVLQSQLITMSYAQQTWQTMYNSSSSG